MKTGVKLILVSLLLFNGIGVLIGGWNLMLHPDGSSIELSTLWLKHTPFKNFFIPGVVLFAVNGVFSILCLVLLIFKYRHIALLTIIQGVILLGWIVVQALMMRTVYWLHIVCSIVAVLMLACGYWMHMRSAHESKLFREKV